MKMRHAAIWLMSLAGFSAIASAEALEPPQFRELGHEFLGFGYGGSSGYAVGDFDGDGRDDVAFASHTFFADGWVLFVVGKNAAGDFVFKQQTLLDDLDIRRVVAVPQAAGAPHLLALSYSGTVREYAGWPLAETQHFATLANANTAVAGDVAGDGVPRVVVRSSTQIAVYAIATGVSSWTLPSIGEGNLLLAQLDADAASEIVVGDDSAAGLILDGATGATDWSYPDPFGKVAAGALGANHEIQFAGLRSGAVTLYSGAPFSPLWDFQPGFAFTPTDIAVGEIDGNGRAKIVLATHSGAAQILDTATHQAHPLGSTQFEGPLALFDADGNGLPALFYFNTPEIGVIHGQTGAARWTARSRDVSFSSMAVGDIDRDGKTELLSAYGPGLFGDAATGFQVRSMDSGASLRTVVPTGGSGYGTSQIAPTRILIDSELPGVAPQIVLAGQTAYDGRIQLLDGATNAVSWDVYNYASGPLQSRPISDAILIDMDGDGVRDIVAATQPSSTFTSGSKLHAYSLSGQPIWESVAMGNGFQPINSVFALSPESGAGDVVVAVPADSLRAYGRLSHLLAWTLSVANTGAVVVPVGASGAEIAVLSGKTLQFFEASTRNALRSFDLDDDIDAVTALDGRLDRLLISSGGILRWIDGNTGTVLAQTPWLGGAMARRNQLAVETLGGGHWRIGVGGGIGIYRYELTTDALFGAGFDDLGTR